MKPQPVGPVGRTRELQLGHDALQNAVEGRGGATILQGEPGIGKTAILEEMIRAGKALGAQIRQGRAGQLEAYRPFGVLMDAISLPASTHDPRFSKVARLLRKPCPEDFGPTDAQLRFRIVDALVELLQEMSQERPLVLALDDAHWADVSTVMTLERLSARLGRIPVLLILSFRPEQLHKHHRQLLESLCHFEAANIKLEGLDAGAQAELVRRILGAEPDTGILSSLSIAEGRPLRIITLLEEMTAQGIVDVNAGSASLERPFRARSLEEVILLRIKRLSPECRRILQVASVFGCTFSADDLATLFDGNTASLLPFLSEAYEAGILIDSGAQLSFSSELVREALYNDMPSSVTRAIHSDTARQLSQKGASPNRVAAHYLLGASPGDRQAVAWLRRAAHETSARSPETGVEFLETALLLSEDSPQDRTEILAQMLNVLALTGEVGRAEALARELLSVGLTEPLAIRVKRDLARTLWRQGRAQDAAKLLREVSSVQGLSDTFRARFLAEAAYLQVKFEARPDASTELALQAKALGQSSGDRVAVGMALHVLGRKAWWKARFARGAALQAKALEIAEEEAQEVQYFTPHQHLALCLMELDRFQEAEAVLERGLSMVHEIGEKATYFHQYHAIYGYLYTLTGRWQEAKAQLETHVAMGKDRRTYREAFEAALSLLAYLAIHSDDLRAAEHYINLPGEKPDRVVVALFHSAVGNTEAARAELAALDADTLPPLPIYRRLVWPEAVILATALELPQIANVLLGGITRLAALNRIPSAQGAWLRTRGLLEDNLELLDAAVSIYETSERILETASCFEEAAVSANYDRQEERARNLLLKAMEYYEKLGATRDLRRTDAFARELGIARGVRARRQHATRGWHSLTKTERKVLAMIAEGMSNKRIAERLYISPRTAETHVMHIFRKLGLKSRAEAAAAVAKQSDPNAEDGGDSTKGQVSRI